MDWKNKPGQDIPVKRFLIFAVFISLSLLAACSPSWSTKHSDGDEYRTEGYRILFGGDFSYGDTYEAGREIIEKYGYDHSMKAAALFLNEADFSIVNLETPVTSVDIRPYIELKRWVHRGDPGVYSRYMKKYGLNAVSLANNHTVDCGMEGLRQTLRVLDTNSFLRIGAGLNAAEAASPLIKEIVIGNKHITLALFNAYEDRRGISAGPDPLFASDEKPGVNLLLPERIAEGIKAFRDKHPDGFVVVFPHWGSNYAWKSASQDALAKQLIDSGADVIIGHGAHMLQEIERYKDKWIIYSLGNFVFNTPGRYEKENAWPYSAIAILNFVPEHDTLNARVRLYPMFTDNPATNYQGRPVDEKEFKRIVERLKERNKMLSEPPENLIQGRDKLGFYLEAFVF